MNNPLISIILTSYNQPELLERAFNSLINQTYKNIEIIIVDDHSQDDKNNVLIRRFMQENPKKVKSFFQTFNVGIAKNKNAGFKLASGDYITYLDGDDTYYENKIASEVSIFLKRPEISIVYSNFDIKDVQGNILSVWAGVKKPAEGYIFPAIILNKFPDCHTHRCEMFKRNVLHDLNFYDEQFSVYHDLDFMLRYSLYYQVAYNDYIGSSYYKNSESIVAKTEKVELIEQQQHVYGKFTEAIKEYNLEKPFKKYLQDLNLNKLFYLERFRLRALINAFYRNPTRPIKILRIVNYLIKIQKTKA